ncbi:TIGR02206 family membrane protein [Aquibacillus halophilus]|uniref:TIGR02206 family membrane protein n=2 Tax=Aquibacillus halophilus TaxID=930132 RepID=A0A6A8DE85_9BACI|nr:TIGR02206 family membrane protein [Aquibacillus halophilus]
MLAIYLIGIISMLCIYKQIINNTTFYQAIRWLFFFLLLFSEISYQLWAAVNGVWNLRDHMPLHLCGVASIIAMIALLFNKEKLIQFAFFIGIIPAFLALVTPELPYDYQHFRFWKFFVHHIVISWACVFLILTSTARITFKSFIGSFCILVGYGIFIGILINPLLGSNYLYLSNTPTASTPLNFFGTGFWYYSNLGLVTLSVFFLLFVCYSLYEKHQLKKVH